MYNFSQYTRESVRVSSLSQNHANLVLKMSTFFDWIISFWLNNKTLFMLNMLNDSKISIDSFVL